MAKRLRLLIIFILGFYLCIPVKTAIAEDVRTVSSEGNLPSSGLYLNIHELEEYRAERGLKNLEPHSLVLTDIGLKAYNENRGEEAIVFFTKAKELSPDLPLTYLYLSNANLSLSLKGIYTSLGYLLDTLGAFYRNFWWSFQTAGILSVSLFLALCVSIIVFLIILISLKFRLYIHDIIEDKRKIFLLLPAFILAFFGPIFGLIGFLLPFWVYMKRREKVVLYCGIGILAINLLILPLFWSFLGAFQDRTLRSIVKINEGTYSGETSNIDTSKRGYESTFAHALDLKRKGFYDEAIRTYDGLLNQRDDAKVYNNIANCYVGLGNYDMAVAYYNKSIKLKKMASSYYNLSQLYREHFNFSDAKGYYQKAIKIDTQKVDFYNSVRGTSVNRFVMDEYLSTGELWYTAFKWYPYYESSMFLGRILTFTNRGFSIVILFLLAFALYVYNRYVSRGAYRCRRCGKIYCSSCEKRISREDVCLMCYKTLVEVSELGPKERIEKILEIQRYRDDRNQRLKILTFILPGSGHIYSGLNIYGFLILLSFAFFLFSALQWFYIPAIVSMKQAAVFFGWASVSGLILVYGLAVISAFRRTPRKWL
ncbi:MAG: tetratricopeptide repeat protein [Thermodesulfovibrionia bacterium]